MQITLTMDPNDAIEISDEELNDIDDDLEEDFEITDKMLEYESSDDENEMDDTPQTPAVKRFKFSNNPNDAVTNINLVSVTPISVYQLFVDKSVLELIVNYTNLFAENYIRNNDHMNFFTRTWYNVTVIELKKFLGIVLYTSVMGLPKLSDYWRHDELYEMKFCDKIMSQYRFQTILKCLHFTHPQMVNYHSKTHKIDEIMNLINRKFQKYRKPVKNFQINESTIPFRGRLKNKEFIPGKRHKYNFKFFKLIDLDGYTYDMVISMAKENELRENELRKTMKWFHKVGFVILMKTAIVNSLIVYNQLSGDKMPTITFIEILIKSLVASEPVIVQQSTTIYDLDSEEHTTSNMMRTTGNRHELVETKERLKNNRKIRKRCKLCYREESQLKGVIAARKNTKQVSTYCFGCPEKPFLCIKHFNVCH